MVTKNDQAAIQALSRKWANKISEGSVSTTAHLIEQAIGECIATQQAVPEAPATEQQATGDGFALSFSREDWGVIFDGVMLEIERSEKRKQANAESNSDARAVQGRAILTAISDASHATPAATTASASEERVIGGQRWSKEAEMVESWCATAPSCNADWQSGYKTGYETGLGDGRAEFTNPAATSPAERAALAATEKKEQK